MELKDVVAISAVRTAMGRFGGTLRNVPAYDLGAAAIRAALRRAGVAGDGIDAVIFGSCRQAGNGPNPARTAAVRAGLGPLPACRQLPKITASTPSPATAARLSAARIAAAPRS